MNLRVEDEVSRSGCCHNAGHLVWIEVFGDEVSRWDRCKGVLERTRWSAMQVTDMTGMTDKDNIQVRRTRPDLPASGCRPASSPC